MKLIGILSFMAIAATANAASLSWQPGTQFSSQITEIRKKVVISSFDKKYLPEKYSKQVNNCKLYLLKENYSTVNDLYPLSIFCDYKADKTVSIYLDSDPISPNVKVGDIVNIRLNSSPGFAYFFKTTIHSKDDIPSWMRGN